MLSFFQGTVVLTVTSKSEMCNFMILPRSEARPRAYYKQKDEYYLMYVLIMHVLTICEIKVLL